jgi:hypothetical protein
MAEIIHSFIAFNINGFNHLYYMLSHNISIVIILIAAVITSVLSIKDVVLMSTRDEQHII